MSGKAAEPAPVPPVEVALEITPAAAGAPWRVRLTNKESTPVRIVADPRLLSFELTTPAPPPPPEPTSPARKPETKKPAKPVPPLVCVLPGDARPASDEDGDRDLVLPPSRSWSATFDPLFYCFGERERAALVPGTTIKARYGWPAGRGKPAAPFVAVPRSVSGNRSESSEHGPTKVLEGDAFPLKDPVASDPTEKAATNEASASPTLSTPPSVDVARGNDVATDVTLTNPNDRSVTLLFRANLFEFTVVGPRAGVPRSIECGEPRSVTAPIRELFTTVPAKGTTQTSVLIASACPAGTFDDAGIYRVFPRLDTREASGQSLGIRTWDGVTVGKTPLLVRVRSSRSTDLSRPTID